MKNDRNIRKMCPNVSVNGFFSLVLESFMKKTSDAFFCVRLHAFLTANS